MAATPPLKNDHSSKMLLLLVSCLVGRTFSEVGDCREQEFLDSTGSCRPCRQCGPGKELSKECGFGYGEDAQCLPCRPNRFKEDWGFPKCKPCLDCATINRYQKSNCTPTSNAVCGDCLPGFYRKTKLGGFQDMECVPCGDPPPPYEPHCNRVKIPTTASSPRDTALAAVICSALATVLLALLILSIIYCKRQYMEKKPSWSSRSQELQYTGSELLCFDRTHFTEPTHRACCRCQQESTQACGPVHLIPSLCCDETYSRSHGCKFRSHSTLYERNTDSLAEMIPTFLGSTSDSACREPAETWPLMQSSSGKDPAPVCEPYPDATLEDTNAVDANPREPMSLCMPSDCSTSTETCDRLTQSVQSPTLHESLQLAACRAAGGSQPGEEGSF
ncbi:tumor necrosis factor receptor superfamily member 19 [Pelobates fuscus]|uniref:tumor necrosis factor receptor superfamily member 19 n=1 Tax=Pelobates fuscus TaxID=191477 RepID=UPI002FE44579